MESIELLMHHHPVFMEIIQKPHFQKVLQILNQLVFMGPLN